MAVNPIRIPTRNQAQPIVDDQNRATTEFHRWLNDTLSQVVYAVNAIAALPQIQDALQNLDDATKAAQAAANSANTAALTTTKASALANSYVTGLTITSADAGSSVTVTVSAHQRVYATVPTPTTVAVSGGTITGVPYGTTTNPQAYVYYDQASRAGGTVAYQYSFNNSDVAQINDRHSVGVAPLPMAAGQPSKPGKAIVPPGGSYDINVLGTA